MYRWSVIFALFLPILLNANTITDKARASLGVLGEMRVLIIDDELKAIYHSRDTLCIWVFQTREDRNKFVDDTAGMIKAERESHYEEFYM